MAKTISTSAVKGRKTATGSKKVSDSKTILKRKREEVESDNDNGDDDEEENDDEDNNDDDDEDKDDDGDSDGDDDEEEDEEEEVEEELPQRSKKSSSSSTKNTAPAKKTKKPLVKSKKVLKKQKKMLKSSGTSSSSSSSGDKLPKAKKMRKLERLEEARKAFKWWEAPELPNGRNWFKLEHAGINFAPAYVRHNIPFKYDGKVIPLNDEQEELASFYAAMPNDGPQLGNPKTRPVFQKNFFKDFKESFPAGKEVKLFEKCDFSAITEYLDLQKSLRKAANDEEKAVKKVAKETVQLKFGYALIDGRMEKMGNFNMEPPGLFRGRGEHPKTGMVKKRCFAESVSINLSEDACPPICTLPGHAWESVRHDPAVTWLCSWNENVLNSIKYVMLAASSSFKGKSDTDKYQKAIRLKGCIHKVRKDYTQKLKSSDRAERQLGTAMWVIDILALRVGGEKGEDEADTVGCCSLRKEHLKFNSDPNSFEAELEFYGKDSMLYKQTISFARYGDLGKTVYKCLKSFCDKKKDNEEIFETLDPPTLNKHLTSLMKGLTAKVFRTFNASITLENELPTAESLEGMSIQDKVVQYNAANRQVAILCNHQKTVSKAAETMFENLNEKLSTMHDQQQTLLQWKDLVKKGKQSKIPLKADDKELIESLTANLQSAQNKKEKAQTTDEKLAAASALDEAKAAIKQDQGRRFEEKHMFKLVPTIQSIELRIEKWNEDIRKFEVDIRNRDENKEVALGTSKINYMDPRISVAWCKRCEVPIDKVFAKTLRDKFNWAMAVSPDWKFE